MDGQISLRRFQDEDEVAVVGVWFRSGKAAYPFLPMWQVLTIEQAETISETSSVHDVTSGWRFGTLKSWPT